MALYFPSTLKNPSSILPLLLLPYTSNFAFKKEKNFNRIGYPFYSHCTKP